MFAIINTISKTQIAFYTLKEDAEKALAEYETTPASHEIVEVADA